MLTEGWDANTITHILGIRAFGTQLLCEQVVGRGLRRYSYELNDGDLFNVEYADIMGIPFDFTAKPQVAPVKPPKKTTRVHAVKEHAALEIVFPRVTGYRVELPEERLTANFTEDSKFVLTPELVGPGQISTSISRTKTASPSCIYSGRSSALPGSGSMTAILECKGDTGQWMSNISTLPKGLGAHLQRYRQFHRVLFPALAG